MNLLIRGAATVKVVIFGLTLSSSWGNGHATPYRAILKALKRRGIETTFYEKDVQYYSWRRDFSQCDYCNLVLYSDWDEIRPSALRECEQADVVMSASYVPEGARINDELLELVRPLRVFYDLDTPITLKALQAGEVDYLRADQIPGFDLYLSFTGGTILHTLTNQYGAALARPLYGGVDPEVYERSAIRPEFQCDLSYMGTYAPDRQVRVDEFFRDVAQREPGRKFVLAGSMYPLDLDWPPNVRRFDHVPPADHPALYSSSRFTLNITRYEMAASGYCPSGRFFEAAACGTPIVSDYFQGLESFFDLKEELIMAKSSGDVQMAMRMGQAELDRIATRARQRTLAEHTGENRATDFLRYLDEAWSRVPGPSIAGAPELSRLGAA